MKDDIYSNIYTQKNKQSSHDTISDEILQEASKLESQNYSMAHSARKNLQSAQQTQKETGKELISQGEQLKNIEGDAKDTHENVKKSEQLTKDIKKEGKLIHFGNPFSFVKKMFKKDDKNERELKTTLNKKDESKHNTYKSDKNNSKNDKNLITTDKEDVPGEAKTNKELNMIYSTLKDMKKDASTQQQEIKKQKLTTERIGAYSKASEAKMKKTEEELKKIE
ncbi:hypothetical protein SLOPH_2354 [Spraguea lophii 42_110]|uniref:t-SNARE coiled-coil homology domain-containing protein n=1 Tax=Spraguea lophii (strain 42_110) TaxID=1358809 RepID=S7WA16_SPRLO|nr:hypothetical protein SLOPH_2354 [Spraguea lophii 42_110]